jgi:hypothetical protein
VYIYFHNESGTTNTLTRTYLKDLKSKKNGLSKKVFDKSMLISSKRFQILFALTNILVPNDFQTDVIPFITTSNSTEDEILQVDFVCSVVDVKSKLQTYLGSMKLAWIILNIFSAILFAFLFIYYNLHDMIESGCVFPFFDFFSVFSFIQLMFALNQLAQISPYELVIFIDLIFCFLGLYYLINLIWNEW